MTVYKPRSAWTSSRRGGAQLTGSKLVGIAWHWPGTSQDEIGVESEAATANRLRGYRNFHVGTRGWSDIGYNFAIDQAGRVWMLRSTQWHGNLVGAHAASGSNPNANHHYVGVLLLLGASETPSTAMVAAFRDWYYNRFLPKWPGRTDVRGHGQVPGAQTSCPGSRARAAISTMTAKPSGGSTGGSTVSYNEIWRTDNKMTGPGKQDAAEPGKYWTPESVLEYIGHALYKRIDKKDGTDDTLTPRQLWQWAYAHAREARGAAEANSDKLDALLAAQEGLDTAAVLERIDTRHNEAAQQRQVIADTVADKLDAIADATQGSDPAEAKLAAILEILGVDA